jgi:hypothetical protein
MIVPFQMGKTESISRPLLLCGVNQWIGRSAGDFPSCDRVSRAGNLASCNPCKIAVGRRFNSAPEHAYDAISMLE